MSFWTNFVSSETFSSLNRFRTRRRMLIILPLVLLSAIVFTGSLAQADLLNDGLVSNSTDPTPEVSTNELKAYLQGDPPPLCDPTNPQNIFLFDARPSAEYAMSHIPCARNVAQKPGTPTAEYISDAAEIERIVGEDNKDAMVILYCNGPFCGKTKRLASDLLADPYYFTNVLRYQAGAPVWRALVGTMQIEASALREVWVNDGTSRIYDARPNIDRHSGGRIPRSIVLPVDEVLTAKEDGRLPMEDHNTRIICFGEDGTQAKELADAISKNAFHNVTFFNGTAEEFREAIFHETGH
jgi:rhodanese-related sulfurtransferase